MKKNQISNHFILIGSGPLKRKSKSKQFPMQAITEYSSSKIHGLEYNRVSFTELCETPKTSQRSNVHTTND